MALAADPTAAVPAGTTASEGTEDAVSLRGPAARTAPGPDAEHPHPETLGGSRSFPRWHPNSGMVTPWAGAGQGG